MASKAFIAAALSASVALSGCVSPIAGPGGLYASPVGSARVTANPTPYSAALNCLAGYARAHKRPIPRIAVGRILDYTAKEEENAGGRKITQGASLMAMSALAKAGAAQVERFDTSVSEMELKYANNRLISETAPTPGQPGPYRKINSGQVAGSDYYIVGGITELNYNIRSSGADAYIGGVHDNDFKGMFDGSLFVMNVAIDLRLVNTQTTEVVDVVSYQKQIIGRQVSGGIFRFFGGNAYDISAGEGALEPIQLSVRALTERAVLEFMTNLYGAPGPQVCLDPRNDYLAGSTVGLTGGYIPQTNVRSDNARTREDPAGWSGGDADANARRGRY